MSIPVNSRDIYLQSFLIRTSDEALSIEEKPSVINTYDQILNNKIVLESEAIKYNITTEKIAYLAAITALTIYLGTLTIPVNWNDLSNLTKINRTVFNQKFKDVDDAKKVLELAISAKNGISGYLTSPTTALPCNSSGTVLSYASATGTFRVFSGTTEVTGVTVTYSVAASSAATGAINSAGVFSVSSLTADTGNITLRAVYAGVTLDYKYTIVKAKAGVAGTNGTPGVNGDDGVDGSPGIRGSRMFYLSGYTSWNSAAATAAASIDGGPILSDTVTEYGTGFSQMRSWNGSSWITISQVIDGNLLVNGTVLASSFVASAFTGYIFTGSIFRTAASGQRVAINESSDNKLKAYDSSGTMVAEIGGTSGTLYVPSTGTLIPAIYAISSGTSLVPTINGQSDGSGPGVRGVSASGYGVEAFSSSGTALRARGGTSGANLAFSLDGGITQVARGSGVAEVKLNDVIPVSTNTYYCGTAGAAWAGMTSQTALVVTSDIRNKTEILDSDLGLNFINSLRPVSYTLVEGRKEIVNSEEEKTITKSIAGKRRHYGLIAQEVKASLKDKDAAFWILTDNTDPESLQALRYEELISPMIKAIQELHSEIALLKIMLK